MNEQHPVPQQISAYQFRLVGDMTLKQFIELAAGALVGLLFYASAIPTLFKWPLIVISVLFGAALAFLPLEDRPLEVWVLAFLRSIYSPTLFFWSKTQIPEVYFQEESAPVPALNVIAPHGEAELNKYLEEAPSQKNPFFKALEDGEKVFLSKVTGLFGQFVPQIPSKAPGVANQQITQSGALPLNQIANKPISQLSNQPVNPAPLSKVEIPKTEFIKVTPLTTQGTQAVPIVNNPVQQTPMAPISTTPLDQNAQPPQYSFSASPPMGPTQPNTLSGQVMDSSGRIIESAILEIKDSAGRPVRAVKTNKLGHFYIVTPLTSGGYEIITEKDGYEFDNIRFLADGKIIPPMAIRSKGTIGAQLN